MAEPGSVAQELRLLHAVGATQRRVAVRKAAEPRKDVPVLPREGEISLQVLLAFGG